MGSAWVEWAVQAGTLVHERPGGCNPFNGARASSRRAGGRTLFRLCSLQGLVMLAGNQVHGGSVGTMGNKAKRVGTAALAKRILVVDDEPLVCDSVKWMLLSFGHEVEAVTSGEQALALFDKSKFDLVIIDYLMPG